MSRRSTLVSATARGRRKARRLPALLWCGPAVACYAMSAPAAMRRLADLRDQLVRFESGAKRKVRVLARALLWAAGVAIAIAFGR